MGDIVIRAGEKIMVAQSKYPRMYLEYVRLPV